MVRADDAGTKTPIQKSLLLYSMPPSTCHPPCAHPSFILYPTQSIYLSNRARGGTDKNVTHDLRTSP